MALKLKQRYGEWALVTGGHTGIGYALCEGLAAEGINLVISARTQKSLDEAASKLIAAYGVKVETIAADCSTRAGVDALLAATDTLKVKIGIIIPNAGVEMHGHFVDHDVDSIERMIYLNVTAPTLLALHFGRLMASRGQGAILFVSSLLGFNPGPYMGPYTATKSYVNTLGQSIRTELAGMNVDVTVLAPGVTATNMSASFDMAQLPFPTDTAKNTANVGLRALGRVPIRVPLLKNRLSIFLTVHAIPGFISVPVFAHFMKRTFHIGNTPTTLPSVTAK